ncbi:MAG: ferredoxin [Mycobacterium sp.]|nr:ferredoxin [Mycobacterium sp.]
MSTNTAEVSVDPEICMGSGTCIAVAPELFEIGEDGTARPRQPFVEAGQQLNMAVNRCPAGAIRSALAPSP